VDVGFVGRFGRVGVGPDFGDHGPIIDALEAMPGSAADMNGGADRSDGGLGWLGVGGAGIDADRALNHFPEFLAAVVVLPREAGVGSHEENFRA